MAKLVLAKVKGVSIETLHEPHDTVKIVIEQKDGKWVYEDGHAGTLNFYHKDDGVYERGPWQNFWRGLFGG